MTTFSAGKTSLKGTPISFPTALQIWCRIGEDGEIFRGTRARNSFTVDNPGRLYVGTMFPGEFASRTGALATPAEAYDAAEGDLSLLVVRWQTEAIDALRRLASVGDVNRLIANEIDRFANQVPAPKGWDYLWFVGPAEIYSDCHKNEYGHAICCHTDNNGALLIKDCALPLKPGTRLRWA